MSSAVVLDEPFDGRALPNLRWRVVACLVDAHVTGTTVTAVLDR